MNATVSLPALLAPLNEAITPALRLGLINPLPFTTGVVLLEVTGRVSGRVRKIPLVCTDYGDVLAVSTVRRNSQWLKNLAVTPEASIWLRGAKRTVTAEVYAAGERISADATQTDWRSDTAACMSRMSGMSLALLRLR
jgi:hypothetical protein